MDGPRRLSSPSSIWQEGHHQRNARAGEVIVVLKCEDGVGERVNKAIVDTGFHRMADIATVVNALGLQLA